MKYKNTSKSMQYQAEHDFLTDTLNRRALVTGLNDIFNESKKNNQLHAYLFLDLDRFKSINDRYGHDTGDKLLVELVERIRPLLNKEDILARMSGDEFAIILKNIDGDSPDGMRRINEVCAKLSSELSRPFILNQYEISTSASIGVRLFPDDVKKASDVMLHADAAMYRSKKKMKGSVTLFDEKLAQEFEEANLLKEELEHAYENNEYIFFFQPKVDVHTNRIKSVEILVRWQHPTRGLLFPDDFFKEAIDIGMLSKITDLSIHRACEFLVSTKEHFFGSIAINVSSTEIVDTFFISRLVSVIKEYGIDTKRIELEITEDELIKNFDFAIILIKKLQKLGIRVSIDDFGTGYSSITYLQKLPVDTLKIDKSFIRNLHTTNDSDRDLVLVKTITSMAKAFNIEIVAEGVENEAQLSIVKKLGIDEYQGFLFSEAVNKDTFLELIKNKQN
jgi:diguanylate cyclase (GGDEF)-like protein